MEEKSQTKSDTPSARNEEAVVKTAPINLSNFFKKVSPERVRSCNKLDLTSSGNQKENTNSHSNIQAKPAIHKATDDPMSAAKQPTAISDLVNDQKQKKPRVKKEKAETAVTTDKKVKMTGIMKFVKAGIAEKQD